MNIYTLIPSCFYKKKKITNIIFTILGKKEKRYMIKYTKLNIVNISIYKFFLNVSIRNINHFFSSPLKDQYNSQYIYIFFIVTRYCPPQSIICRYFLPWPSLQKFRSRRTFSRSAQLILRPWFGPVMLLKFWNIPLGLISIA